jgi:hypothetical protein
MSVIFGVIPFDSTIPEFVEWLEEKDITVPDEHGRYPTFDEVVRTLETFGEFPVYKEQVTGDLWEVAIGKLYSPTYAHLLGTIEDDDTFHFHFEKGSEDTTMLEILKRLSHKCGPLVLFDHYSATPVLVTSTTVVSVALQEWYQRMATKH